VSAIEAAPVSATVNQTVLIAGLSKDSCREEYFLVGADEGCVAQWSIDIEEQRAAVLRAAESRWSGGPLPYGVSRLEQLLPYWLHPHSFLQVGEQLAISFKQAPYLRVLDPLTRETRLVAPGARSWEENTLEWVLGSTCAPAAGEQVVTAAVRFDDQMAALGSGAAFAATVFELDLATGVSAKLAALPPFVTDSVHEVAVGEAGHIVTVDMNLAIDAPPLPGDAWEGSEPADVEGYAAYPFPPSRFVVTTPDGQSTIHRVETACPSHVDFDVEDPEVFFISCNNISKRQSSIVLHGPGAIERYEMDGERPCLTHRFYDPRLLRITTVTPFLSAGERLLAATGYPNELWIFDADDLSVRAVIELFEAEIRTPPFICGRNGKEPLYLAPSEDGSQVILSGAGTAFVVSLVAGRVTKTHDFAPIGSFAATAHIGNVSL
jgi:hypothetical protein